MTPPATETPPLPLDPATLVAMRSAIVDALPPRPGATEAEATAQREGAFAFFAALWPRDPIQAMLAVHIVASHYGAMECFRRAARDDLSIDLHTRILAKAVALCRRIEKDMNDLARRQGIPALRPVARVASVPAAKVQPASVTAPQVQPAPEVVRAGTPTQPPGEDNRQARRQRKWAERRLAKVAQRAGLGNGAVGVAMQQLLAAEVAARAAAPRTAAV